MTAPRRLELILAPTPILKRLSRRLGADIEGVPLDLVYTVEVPGEWIDTLARGAKAFGRQHRVIRTGRPFSVWTLRGRLTRLPHAQGPAGA